MKRPWELSRRAVLRGAGTLVALPLLEAMRPSIARAQAAGVQAPRRLLFFYVPNGIHMPAWTPEKTGTGYDLKPILAPLGALRDKTLVLTGLANRLAKPDGPGDHAGGTSAFLTCAHANKSESEIFLGVSVDQVAAKAAGDRTRFRSLELGIDGGRIDGGCDSGYSCAYTSNISWSGPQTPMAKETDVGRLFDRLFVGVDPSETREQILRRKLYKQSILDFVREDTARVQAKLGAADKSKLDEFLTGLRSVERQVASIDVPLSCDPGAPPTASSVSDRIDRFSDVMALAFQCDLTRIVSFMSANAGSGRAYPELGVNEGHHDLSHHGSDPLKYAKLTKIATWEVERLAYLLQRLDAIEEADGSVLDNSLVLFSSEIEDGNAHRHTNLPVLVAGSGGGAVTTGRHVKMDETPIANLFLSMLHAIEVPEVSFGDSTGLLPDLA